MNSQLKAFEDYINSLTNLGVFPSFHRHSNGWTCLLRNGANKQIMPFVDETCWGETLMDAVTAAVEGLNKRFSDSKALRQFIDTGIDQSTESVQTEPIAYAR
jgi:hypothetical protein